jgi:SulP family sulfate permease
MSDIGTNIPVDVDSDVIKDYSDLPKDISIYEISGPLFFASAKQYAETLKVIGLKSSIIIIRMRHVPFIDSTGLHNLEEAVKRLKILGVVVVLSGVNSSVLKYLDQNGFFALVNKSQVFDSFDNAVDYAKTIEMSSDRMKQSNTVFG